MASNCRSDSLSPSSMASKLTENLELTSFLLVAEEEPWSDENCHTPTAKESRIPEVLTCPPAPKKRRSDHFQRFPPVKEYFLPPNLNSIFSELSKVK